MDVTVYTTTGLHRRRGVEVTGPIRSAACQRNPQLTRKQRRELQRQAEKNVQKRIKAELETA